MWRVACTRGEERATGEAEAAIGTRKASRNVDRGAFSGSFCREALFNLPDLLQQVLFQVKCTSPGWYDVPCTVWLFSRVTCSPGASPGPAMTSHIGLPAPCALQAHATRAVARPLPRAFVVADRGHRARPSASRGKRVWAEDGEASPGASVALELDCIRRCDALFELYRSHHCMSDIAWKARVRRALMSSLPSLRARRRAPPAVRRGSSRFG